DVIHIGDLVLSRRSGACISVLPVPSGQQRMVVLTPGERELLLFLARPENYGRYITAGGGAHRHKPKNPARGFNAAHVQSVALKLAEKLNSIVPDFVHLPPTGYEVAVGVLKPELSLAMAKDAVRAGKLRPFQPGNRLMRYGAIELDLS